jgi:two-component system response regulator
MKTVMFAGPDATARGLLQYVGRATGAPLHMVFVRNTPETLSYLSGHGPFAHRSNYPLPDLLVLDLTNPHMNAWAVIDWLKERPEFGDLRVCFIGRQADEAAAAKARPHGPCFFTKPADVDSYTNLVSAIAALSTEPSGIPTHSARHHTSR